MQGARGQAECGAFLRAEMQGAAFFAENGRGRTARYAGIRRRAGDALCRNTEGLRR